MPIPQSQKREAAEEHHEEKLQQSLEEKRGSAVSERLKAIYFLKKDLLCSPDFMGVAANVNRRQNLTAKLKRYIDTYI